MLTETLAKNRARSLTFYDRFIKHFYKLHYPFPSLPVYISETVVHNIIRYFPAHLPDCRVNVAIDLAPLVASEHELGVGILGPLLEASIRGN